MRVLAWLGVVIGWVILIIVSAVGIVVLLPRHDPVASSVGSMALTVMWISTISVGSVAYWFDTSGSPSARRAIRPARIAGATLLLAGAVVLLVLVVVAGLALWFALAAIAAAIALQLAAGPVAHRLGRSARTQDAARTWAPVDLARLRRGRRIAILVGLAATLVVAALMTVLSLTLDDDPYGPRDAVATALLGLDFGLLAAGIALMIPVFRMSAQIRTLFGGDLAKGRRVAKKVLRGRGELEPGDERAAARYAQVIPAHQENSFGAIVLIEAGVLLGVVNGGLDEGFGFSGWIVVLGVVAIAVATVVTLSRLPRARRYAREHAAEADADSDAAPEPGPAST